MVMCCLRWCWCVYVSLRNFWRAEIQLSMVESGTITVVLLDVIELKSDTCSIMIPRQLSRVKYKSKLFMSQYVLINMRECNNHQSPQIIIQCVDQTNCNNT